MTRVTPETQAGSPIALPRPRPVLALAAPIALAYGGSLPNELVFDDRIFMQRSTGPTCAPCAAPPAQLTPPTGAALR